MDIPLDNYNITSIKLKTIYKLKCLIIKIIFFLNNSVPEKRLRKEGNMPRLTYQAKSLPLHREFGCVALPFVRSNGPTDPLFIFYEFMMMSMIIFGRYYSIYVILHLATANYCQ
jgi:hypothetical protein